MRAARGRQPIGLQCADAWPIHPTMRDADRDSTFPIRSVLDPAQQ
jgi:hypothetical protein